MTYYNVDVYREQGGKKLVVTTSGEIELTGELEVQSGGEIEVLSGGKVDLRDGSSNVCASKFEIASGGEIEVQSGATLDIASGSSATLATDLECGSAGCVLQQHVSRSSTATTDFPKVCSAFCTASSTGVEVALAAPAAGGRVEALCIEASSSASGTFTISSSLDFAGLTTNKIKFDEDDERCILVSSSTAWGIIYSTGTSTS